ncbi:MAG: alpha/beta hydrolase [Solirubrobacterales bacterium]
MPGAELKRAAGLAYREALPELESQSPPLLCIHGFPETSHMWSDLMGSAATAGHRVLAPDMPGSGDSPADPPNTWERLVEAVESFVDALALGPVVLVVHDWGGLIGLRWACDHPEHVAALVISDTGFFADGVWSGMAEGLRTPGTGEEMLGGLDRESFGQMLAASSAGFNEQAKDEYWRTLSTPAGRAAQLEMYRSGDFGKLLPYEGALGRLGKPALLLWGENDPFAPVGGAHRLRREIAGARLEVVEGSGHFVYADAPDRCAAAITGFLASL